MKYAIFVKYDDEDYEVTCVGDVADYSLRKNIQNLREEFGEFVCYAYEIVFGVEVLLPTWIKSRQERLKKELVEAEKNLFSVQSTTEDDYTRLNEEAKQKRLELEKSYKKQGIGASMSPLLPRNRAADIRSLEDDINIKREKIERLEEDNA